jgi:hypothetical protein
VTLLESLAREQPLTATAFSHSVHNTQAGLFSISTGNRQIGSAVAAGAATFPSAFVEALAVLHRHSGPVLLVVGDEPLPEAFRTFADEPQAAYAVALVLERDDGVRGLSFTVGAPVPPSSPPAWPLAAEFLRWLLSTEPSLTLGTHGAAWRWTRARREPPGAAPFP